MRKVAVLGAAGRVGSKIAENLSEMGIGVRAVIRNIEKSRFLQRLDVEIAIAEYNDARALEAALREIDTAFLLTPENPECRDFTAENKALLDHYRSAALQTGVRRIIGLSSMGAQHAEGTGILLASYRLEHLFVRDRIETQFVRPAYYYSNWTGYLEIAGQTGVLPTFFPPQLKLPMIAPADVADFCASLIADGGETPQISEIEGPEWYSCADIAAAFSQKLGRPVRPQVIAPDQWESALLQSGFSPSGARNLARMTRAVIDGRTAGTKNPVKMPTTFAAYLAAL